MQGPAAKRTIRSKDCAIVFGKPTSVSEVYHDVRVEFRDGLAPTETIIEQVPVDYAGIVDLCVCHPTELAKKLRLERPNVSFIRFTNASATLSLWLWFYLALFRYLEEKPDTYLNALNELCDLFLTGQDSCARFVVRSLSSKRIRGVN